ncbi:MAG: ABC transporter permease subunit [Caldilineaceae bacterium]|nr:ABC transporter permease subunit [Caldilineaceae bacterium]
MLSENTVVTKPLAESKPARLDDKGVVTTVAGSIDAASSWRARFLAFYDRYLIYWMVPLLILVIWQCLIQFGLVAERILPAPLAIVRAAIRLTLSGQLFVDVAYSAQRALIGLLIGGGVGFFFGLLNGMFTRSEKYLDTTFQMLRTIPNLALVPLVILWFGIGDGARLFLISQGVLFTMYINTFHGIRQVDTGLIEMGRAYGLSTRQLFWEVILPGALPSILLGLRIALGVMWLTLIIAETIAVDIGIGHMANQAREFIRTDVMVFAVILYALLGKFADVIARWLEGILLQWHPRYEHKTGGNNA